MMANIRVNMYGDVAGVQKVKRLSMGFVHMVSNASFEGNHF